MRLLLGLLLATPAAADELVVEVGEVKRVMTESTGYLVAEVDVSWSRSWRDDTGRDGVWLFGKFPGPLGWATASVFSVEVLEGPLEASPSRDGGGVWVARAEEGRGDVEGRLRLQTEGRPELHVLGLEMVRVRPPRGPACWLARTELDQGLYAAFLNHLPDQATFARAPMGGRPYGGSRGTLEREGDRYVAGRPSAACGFVSWADARALADWAGLRPPRLSELRSAAPGGGLWEPALDVERPALTHGDGKLSPTGEATHADWSPEGRDVVWLGARGTPPRAGPEERLARLGFRPARTAPGELAVLFVGDDATLAHDQPALLSELSLRAGVPRPARVTVRAQAGDRFARMASSESLLDELASGRHEVVVLQEDVALAGGARRSARHVAPLVEAARRGGATPVLVMTWGIRDRPSVAFETAAANVQAWAKELGVLVAPCGRAWRRALARGVVEELHDPAGRNPSEAGAWLNACVLHRLLYGELPAEVEEGVRAELGRVAEEVVREYVQAGG